MTLRRGVTMIETLAAAALVAILAVAIMHTATTVRAVQRLSTLQASRLDHRSLRLRSRAEALREQADASGTFPHDDDVRLIKSSYAKVRPDFTHAACWIVVTDQEVSAAVWSKRCEGPSK